MFTFSKINLTNYLYFYNKIVFNFKYIYTYVCVTCYFFNNLSDYLYFYNKNDI